MQPFGRGSDSGSDTDGVRTASVSFPLTPALSLSPRCRAGAAGGERGNPLQCFARSNRARFADGLAAILPLPKGEGRGEGNRTQLNLARRTTPGIVNLWESPWQSRGLPE